MGIQVELFDDLDAAERDAAGALDRAAQPSLFDRIAWFRLVAEHCPPPGRLIVAKAQEMSRKGWLFLAADLPRARAWANWYSLRVGAVGDANLLEAAAKMLRSGGVADLMLSPMEDPEPLARALRKAGWATFVEPATASWQAATAGMSFDEWWAKRPARLRNTAERKARTAGVETLVYKQFDEVAWAEYEQVYRSSWKPEEGSFPFLRALAEEEGAAGTLRLGIARMDRKAVAAQLWLVENGRATIHKLAYDEAAKALSPGTILSMAMFRSAIDEDRVGRIDYGTGDEPYKADWMDERHLLWRLQAYDPRTLTGLTGIARLAASRLVRRVRRL